MKYTISITKELFSEFIKPILFAFFLLTITLTGNIDRSLAQSSKTPPNVYSPLITATYEDVEVTTTSTPLLTSFNDTDNVIGDINTFATYNYAVTGTGSLRVTDPNATTDHFPAGSYAGFVVDNTILDIEILGETTVTTYLDGDEQESVDATDLLTLGLLGDRARVGFVTEYPFDAIEISYAALGLTGSKVIYYAEILTPGDSPELVCNETTPLVQDDFAVIIEPERTGIDGDLTVGSVSSTENVISDDLDAFGTITVVLGGAVGTGSISVKDIGQSYDAGHFAGFEISNTELVGLDLLNLLGAITITTYLDGEPQEIQSGINQLLLSVSVISAEERHTVGFVTGEEFDEIQITIGEGLLDVDLGTTQVYHAVLTEYCEQAFECGTNFLSAPDFPVIATSGVSGIGCVDGLGVDCGVENVANIVSDDADDFATIEILAGVAGTVSVSVQDLISTYPAGTAAGFVIEDVNNFLMAELFETLAICTYLNGTEQECQSASNLLSFSLFLGFISPGDGRYNVGFVSTEPYDEIRLSVGSLASVLNEINVYNAFVEAYNEDGDENPCPPIEITLTETECYRTLSSPVFGLTYQDMLGSLWTQGAAGSDHPDGDTNLFIWPVDEPDDDQGGWVSLPNMNDEIPAGSGFLISVFEDDEYGVSSPLPWPKTISIPLGPQPGTFLLDGDDMNQHPDGWTLLGNPFQFNIDVTEIPTNDLTGAFYVYDNNASDWVSNAAGFGDLEDNAIAVGQGFFVQTDGNDPSIIFSEESRTPDGTFYGKEQERRNYVRLELRGDDVSNSAWIRFSEHGSFRKTYGDALQLYPFTEQYSVLATQKEEGDFFDIGHFPNPSINEKMEIPLYIDISASGTYTLTATDLDLPAATTLFLRDLQTGETVRIDHNFEYSFTVSKAERMISPDQGLACTNSSPTQAKTNAEQPRFVITNEALSYESELPEKIVLNQNYPNPFNPTTVISFELPQISDVSLQVFDISGRLVATLAEETVEAGTHTVTFNAGNLSSGVYIYTLQAGDVVLNRKLTLIK
ncbi:MAG: T9SS type A sorting domain-containing protein [Balneolaceae bacterium]|nr:T9SS type A sorting domain-containing protein [Balneolaceae bacterium]